MLSIKRVFGPKKIRPSSKKRSLHTIKYLTQDELKRLLHVVGNKRDKALLLVAYRHGLRASEVGLLKLEDIDTSRNRIRVSRVKNSQGGEYLMQNDEVKAVRAWLRERKDDNPYIFSSRCGNPVSRRNLDRMMKIYGRKADLPADKRHFHVLRHSIAVHLLDAGADIRFVQDWLGHTNINNTVVYAHLTSPTRDAQTKKLFASPMIVRG